MRKKQLIIFVVWLTLEPFWCAEGADLQKVFFVPQWLPQAQFAGYYVALEKGFYRDRGLDVVIFRGGPDNQPSERLKSGAADFGTTFLSTAIQKHAEGYGLINIAQIVQRSALMLVAKKSSGINSPQDMNGKKVGLWGGEFEVQPRAFFKKYNLSVTSVPLLNTVNVFLRGAVDVVSAMWYNEYHTIINSGIDPEDLTTFFFVDHGMNFPEDGIYCTMETFKKDPRKCRNFVKASIQGWMYALEHMEEALDIVMKYVNEAYIPTNRAHQKWMLQRMRDIIPPPKPNEPVGAGRSMPPSAHFAQEMGALREEDYYFVSRELLLNGFIGSFPSFTEFHINCAAQHEK